jgi:hypothetical protein
MQCLRKRHPLLEDMPPRLCHATVSILRPRAASEFRDVVLVGVGMRSDGRPYVMTTNWAEPAVANRSAGRPFSLASARRLIAWQSDLDLYILATKRRNSAFEAAASLAGQFGTLSARVLTTRGRVGGRRVHRRRAAGCTRTAGVCQRGADRANQMRHQRATGANPTRPSPAA